ncbi:MAG: VOC family protein [Pseudomonadota bacterium]
MVEHGSVHWNELMTRDVEAAKRFYAETLGWDFQAMPMEEGTYWIIQSGETLVGGLMEISEERGFPADAPVQWMTYIAVDDIDKRLEAVAAAGGQVLRPPFDVPMVGRIAMISDASGCVAGWITPAPSQQG